MDNKKTVLLMRLFIVTLVVLLLLSLTRLSFADEPGYTISIQFENDFFGGGTDRHFTHGTRIELITKPIKWITDAADKLPWFSAEKALYPPEDRWKARVSLSMGQNIYTPEDTVASQLILNDRPYAGWLYLGIGIVANQGSRRYDKLKLEVGIVGSGSRAMDVQNFWHSLLSLRVPNGWDNQLDNEPGAVLYYEQARRFDRKNVLFGLDVDVIPRFGGSLGNVFTYASIGITTRLGPDLRNDFGPPRIRPSLPGGGYFRRKGGFNWYLFAGLEGRVVLQNIFLDGNTFTNSHSVDRKPFVGDIQGGLAIQYKRYRLSYTQIFRTKEFKEQNSADIFGSFSLSYQF
ncbi:MAG: lipid A deacylase LpxR family protein [Thermodesulfobacteriota bacterium]|nr:lipid A deacylase LpxR family protein [Thermodesulfobacteriota bacterium]